MVDLIRPALCLGEFWTKKKEEIINPINLQP